MSSSKHNPFDKEVRGLGHYEKLSRDLNERSDNLLNSLPLFWRSVLIEKSAGWYKEFNRYDLLAPFPVHADFPKLTRLTRAIEVCTTIYAKSRSITEREFRNASIVALNGTLYTVQDFVLSIGYNGGLHWKPTDDKIRLKKLYEEFIEKYPETAFQIVVDITSCLVTVFEEVYNKFTGDNNAYCTVYGCQPMIVKKGNIIRNGKGDTSLLFSNSYQQLPIRKQQRRGIRICLDIQLEDPLSHGFIFCYGHRESNEITLSCEHVPTFLLIKTQNPVYPGLNKIIRVPIVDSMRQEPFKLEVALYENGALAVAIDEWLKDAIKIPSSFSIYDGKLMVGSNLSGERCGSFLNSVLTVEAVDKRYRVGDVFKGGMRLLKSFNLPDLPPNALKRPALI